MEKILEDIFSQASPRSFSAGEIITTGEEAAGVHLITKGFVKVYSISDEGNEYVHIIYKPGEMFPLIWALLGHRRRVFYEALTDTTVSVLARESFEENVKRNPESSYEVIKSLAEQFYVFADRIDNLQYKSAYERVVYRLLFLGGRFGRKTSGGLILEVPITHELIGQTVNLARESVSRQIEKLEKKKLIGYRGSQIIIKDAKALSREFSEPVSLDFWGVAGR